MAKQGPSFTVMSWNVYHGGDIDPILQVGFQDLPLLASRASRAWNEVLANDFRDRAVALVDGIQDTMPDLVGLQEVARFRTLALDSGAEGPLLVDSLDFRPILQRELGSRYLPYSFIGEVENTKARVPVEGSWEDDRFVPTRLVELTLRDAVLVRDGLPVEEVSQGNYRAHVLLGSDPLGGEIRMERGWVGVDAWVGSLPVRIVNTHLEIQRHAEIQVQQAEELLEEIVSGSDGVTVLLGDFNSDAAASPGDRSWTPTYARITEAGFGDAWPALRGDSDPGGLTCCHGSDLRDLTTTLDQRIDFIFFRGPGKTAEGGWKLRPTGVKLVGRGQGTETSPGGRWPSDHAGLLATFSSSRPSRPPAGPPP
ncbi:MAG: hypothetical protein HKO65_01345 [Gemmatimonadetes bacterium]|nr:hypothetical protein [Gemmatimonadota bacterium]